MASRDNALDLPFGGLTTTQSPSIKGEKEICVATPAQIILQYYSLKWVYFQMFATEVNNQYQNIIIIIIIIIIIFIIIIIIIIIIITIIIIIIL